MSGVRRFRRRAKKSVKDEVKFAVQWEKHNNEFFGSQDSWMFSLSSVIPTADNLVSAVSSMQSMEKLPSDISICTQEKTTSRTLRKMMTAGKVIPAHKFILAARSPVFQVMLTGSMKEAVSNEIFITDFSHGAVQAFVRFLYHDALLLGDFQVHAGELLALADKYQVPALSAVCEHHLRISMAVNNILSILKIADGFHAAQLRADALAFIHDHAHEMLEQANCFEDVNAELLRDIVRTLVGHTHSNGQDV